MDRKYKLIFKICVIAIILSSVVNVAAVTYLYAAKDVSYNNNVSGIESTNVQDAIDELYSEVVNLDRLIDKIYPVGSYIETSDTSFNPNNAFSGTTWVLEDGGRVLVSAGSSVANTNNRFGSVSANQYSFTVGEKGGAFLHKHKGFGDGDGFGNGDMRATVGSPTGDASRLNFIATTPVNPNTGSAVGNGTYAVGGSAQQSGKGFSHYTQVRGYTSTYPSMQPYLVVNRWHRTA